MNFISSNTMLLSFLVLPIMLVSGREINESFPETAIPKVFQVSIQTTDSKDRVTTLSKEYYDGINGRGSIITWSKEGKSQITFRKRNDDQVEFFTIKDDVTCKDEQVENNRDGVFVNGGFLFTTAYYLSFLPDMLLKSKPKLHMGIEAESYVGVIPEQGKDTGNDIEYIWKAPDSKWLFPNCPDIKNCVDWWVPLKTIVKMPQPDNTTLQLTYVYYDYKNVIDDPEVFQLPRGVACSLLENTKPFPSNFPKHFEAGMEVYLPHSPSQISTKEQLYYDMDDRMLRLDLDISPDLIQPGMVEHDSQIWDFNTQVIYYIDVKNGSCVVMNMTQADTSLAEQKEGSNGILNFLTSESINLSSLFYVGVRSHRSMKCDVWITNLTSTLIEIYMVNETARNEDGVEVAYSVPVFLNMSSIIEVDEKNIFSMNFFNYDLKVPSLSRFETTSCFIEDFKIRFQIELKGEYIGVIDHNPNGFILQIQKQLATQTKVLPNRFQEILIDDFETPNATDTILFTTTLVENPFNAGHAGSNYDDKKTNQQVYADLSDTIFNSKLIFTFTAEEQSYNYHVVSIRDDVVSIPVTSLKDDIDDSFHRVSAAVITKGMDFQTSGISRMECFEKCVNSIEFECRSWSYCNDFGSCVLSSVLAEHGQEEELEYKDHTNCEFYTRYFLKDYELNKDTATEAKDTETGATLEAKTEAECAKHCSTANLTFYCEGFDSCSDLNSEKITCRFSSRHILEMEPASINNSINCNHYTRDYLGDFLKIKNKSSAFKDFDVSVVAASGAKDCARMCTTSADVNACKGFEMCSPGGVVDKPRTQCRILDASKQETRKLYDDASCDHYTRNNFISDRNKPLHPDDRKPSTAALESKAAYTGGEMFGLAVGMIVLGLLIGGVVVIGVIKYKIVPSQR